MSPLRRLLLILAAAAAALMLGLTFVSRDRESRHVEGERSSIPGPEESVENASTPKGPRVPGDDRDDRPLSARTLQQLRETAPAGQPSEYPISQYSTGNNNVAPWATSLLVDLCGVDLFRAPPYCARFVFGASDRAWLESLHAHYRSALNEALRNKSQGRSAAETEAQVRRPYRDAIWSVAKARLAAAPQLGTRFDDPRSLKKLREEAGPRDPQYLFLTSMIDNLMPARLFEIGLNGPGDRQFLAATDLPELAILRLDIIRIDLEQRDSPTTREQAAQLMRPFAERFHEFIKARIPSE